MLKSIWTKNKYIYYNYVLPSFLIKSLEEINMGDKKPRKRVSSLIMSALILLSALAIINFASTNVRASGIEYFNWNGDLYITTDDTFPHSGNDSAVINITDGNLIICDSVTLTFNDNVTLEFRNPYGVAGDYGILVNSTATFNINSPSGNSIIKSQTGYEYITYSFLNSGTIDFLGATVERVYGDSGNLDTTGGIRNLPGSVCSLENCHIQDADTHSLYIAGEATITNTELTNTTSNVLNGTGITVTGNADVVIDSVTIENTREYGIKCVDAEGIIIQNGSSISNIDSVGIYSIGSNFSISDSTIANCNGTGIVIINTSASQEIIIENIEITNASSFIYGVSEAFGIKCVNVREIK
jgi:hypothetical protein